MIQFRAIYAEVTQTTRVRKCCVIKVDHFYKENFQKVKIPKEIARAKPFIWPLPLVMPPSEGHGAIESDDSLRWPVGAPEWVGSAVLAAQER